MSTVVKAERNDGSSTELVDPRTLYVPPTRAQMLRKNVDPAEVNRVVQNRPMPHVPRSHEVPDDPAEVTRLLFARIFPAFTSIYEESGDDGSMRAFDSAVKAAVADHENLGMHTQAQIMGRQAGAYKALRQLFLKEHDFLRPDSLIPMEYLPDLFMAVPVWYFWESPKAQSRHNVVLDRANRHFANLIPNQRWADTFQMFNYRFRSIREYDGDIIPPKISARMSLMAPFCEHLVIMTPYHDKAGQDWSEIAWLRNIDPYVVGFLKGVPFMLVLGRFSDSGTFPLYSEMVADTMTFLRRNIGKLEGFNGRNRDNWIDWVSHDPVHRGAWRTNVGTHLIKHAREMIAAFDRGDLFDWLRGQDAKPV